LLLSNLFWYILAKKLGDSSNKVQLAPSLDNKFTPSSNIRNPYFFTTVGTTKASITKNPQNLSPY
jgi:hypothetical protein